MKIMNGIHIIGVDHGYGNIKTANCCFPTGVDSSDTEPIFKVNIILYARQQKRHRCIEQSFELCGRRQGWDDLRE